jgi:hypothetical protein
MAYLVLIDMNKYDEFTRELTESLDTCWLDKPVIDLLARWMSATSAINPRTYATQLGCALKASQSRASESLSNTTSRSGEPSRLTTKVLDSEVINWAENIRLQIFGNVKPPHGDIPEAINWLRKQRVQDGIEHYTFGILGDDGKPDLIHLSPASKGGIIVFLAQQMALKTGLISDSLVIHVLSGTIPEKHNWTATLYPPPGKTFYEANGKVGYLNIRINTPLGWNEMVSLYRATREYFKVSHKQSPLQKEDLVLEFIRMRGGAPSKRPGTKRWWDEARDELERQGIATYKSGHVLQSRYRQLYDKAVKNGLLVEPVKEGRKATKGAA